MQRLVNIVHMTVRQIHMSNNTFKKHTFSTFTSLDDSIDEKLLSIGLGATAAVNICGTTVTNGGNVMSKASGGMSSMSWLSMDTSGLNNVIVRKIILKRANNFIPYI